MVSKALTACTSTCHFFKSMCYITTKVFNNYFFYPLFFRETSLRWIPTGESNRGSLFFKKDTGRAGHRSPYLIAFPLDNDNYYAHFEKDHSSKYIFAVIRQQTSTDNVGFYDNFKINHLAKYISALLFIAIIRQI